MVTKYIDFLKENKNTAGITTEEIKLLKKYKIENYRFNEETGKIDVDGDIDLDSKKLKNLPKIRFGVINGYFSCYDNKLTSLKYCPVSVTGYFSCENNQLTSLKYCPVSVTGSFFCSFNKLTSLEYCPTTKTGNFYCDNNQLTSLEYCPSTVTSDFDCHSNQLTSLDYCPTTMTGNFNCNDNILSSLEHCPTTVNRFYCIGNKFTGIENYPLSIIKEKITDIYHFSKILKVVKSKPEVYKPLIESKNKIRFHQQIMRDEPSMIPYYQTIPPPSKRTII